MSFKVAKHLLAFNFKVKKNKWMIFQGTIMDLKIWCILIKLLKQVLATTSQTLACWTDRKINLSVRRTNLTRRLFRKMINKTALFLCSRVLLNSLLKIRITMHSLNLIFPGGRGTLRVFGIKVLGEIFQVLIDCHKTVGSAMTIKDPTICEKIDS
jgi:hypothetical protein